MSRIRDTRMYAKALKQRWPITDEQRQQIVERLMVVVNDPNASRRETIAAAQGLAAVEAQNQKDQHAGFQPGTDGEQNRFLEVAKNLGIGGRFTEVESN